MPSTLEAQPRGLQGPEQPLTPGQAMKFQVLLIPEMINRRVAPITPDEEEWWVANYAQKFAELVRSNEIFLRAYGHGVKSGDFDRALIIAEALLKGEPLPLDEDDEN